MRETKDVLKKLFLEAEEKGGLQYIFTLLRITGITYCKDPLIELESILKDKESPFQAKDSTDESCLFDGVEESLSILGNLLNCSAVQAYKQPFFLSLYEGSFPNIVKPSIEQMLKQVKQHSKQTNHPEMANLLEQSLLNSLLEKEASESSIHYENAKCLLQTLIATYKSERLKFKKRTNFYKLPRFEVLELMVNETDGLYGFRLYFSNGSSAQFVRRMDSTEPLNINFDRDSELVTFVGDLDALTEEWRVGEKKLYEIGLSGRYNKLGEWKPLLYPARKGDILDCLQKKASSLSNDEKVKGVLFYIMCTAHQVIEFVVKTDIQLPWQDTSLGKVIHLWKCPNLQMIQNFCIYDGTYYLNSFDPEEIEMAISGIGLTLNTIAFAYNATMEWRLKYNLINRKQSSFAKLKEKDLNVLKSILEKFPRNKDGLVLNSAIDWYNRGVAAGDVFAGFLCYYRVVETITTSIYQSKASFGLGFKKSKRDEGRQRSLDCIEQKYNELYNQDKFRFVTTAYTECIQRTRAKTEQVLQLVFGEGNKYIKDLFEKPEKENEYSLYQIRNRIAHGNLTLLDKNDVELVRSRLWDMKKIAKELIMRLSCSLKSSDKLPKWSEMRGMAISGYDPRAFLIVNNDKMFPKDADWRIKSEWFD